MHYFWNSSATTAERTLFKLNKESESPEPQTHNSKHLWVFLVYAVLIQSLTRKRLLIHD